MKLLANIKFEGEALGTALIAAKENEAHLLDLLSSV